MTTTDTARPDALIAELAEHLRAALGEEAVIADPAPRYTGDVAVRAADGTSFLLVLPEDTAGVQAVLRLAHETGTPVVPRGAGSGLSGGAAPTHGAIVLGLERLTRIREIDVLDEGIITSQQAVA